MYLPDPAGVVCQHKLSQLSTTHKLFYEVCLLARLPFLHPEIMLNMLN